MKECLKSDGQQFIPYDIGYSVTTLEHAENCGEVDSVNGIDLIWFIVFNTTCNNISAISWWLALVVEEAGVPIDQGQATGKLYHLLLRVECTLFVIYKAGREPTPYWW